MKSAGGEQTMPRGVATARGGVWTTVQVGSILRRGSAKRAIDRQGFFGGSFEGVFYIAQFAPVWSLDRSQPLAQKRDLKDTRVRQKCKSWRVSWA
jgi:hypothetical protein